MKTLITILAVTAILSVTPLAHAAPMELGDSGWAATISNSVSTDIFVDPEGNEYFLLIEIIKTFSAGCENFFWRFLNLYVCWL